MDVYAGPLVLNEHLKVLRFASTAFLYDLASKIGEEFLQKVPTVFLESLDALDQHVCFWAMLICWALCAKVPRMMQLRVILADWKRRNGILVSAGTGSGKTLPMGIVMHMDDPERKWLTITLSPLKRLQLTQLDEFNETFKVTTVVINEDTPRDSKWYSEWIWDSGTRTRGKAMHAIVTTEQLHKSKAGHLSMIATLIRNAYLQRYILRFNVDEAHCVHYDGLPRNGLPAFRPSWGRLDEIQALLPRSVRWSLFSATLPPHILKTLEKKLLPPDYESIRISSNRPNTAYAFVKVDKIDDLRNYECLVSQPFKLEKQPRTLIFVDNKKMASRLAQHLSSLVPPELQTGPKRLVQHYHSVMSSRYHEHTYNEFTKEDGTCRILITTSCNAVGVDFPNVKIVCNIGLPSTLVDILQRAGRAIRTGSEDALFLLFYPSWVDEISLDEYASGDVADLDRTRASLDFKNPKDKDRASYFIVFTIKSKDCRRGNFATYLGDTTPEARLVTARACCDAPNCPHQLESGIPFPLQSFLPGPLRTIASTEDTRAEGNASNSEDSEDENENDGPREQTVAAPGPRRKNPRPAVERPLLELRLNNWLEEAHLADPLAAVRPVHYILSDSQRRTLVRLQRSKVKTAADITRELNETKEWHDEWADKILKVIEKFHSDFKAWMRAQPKPKAQNKKRSATTSTPAPPSTTLPAAESTQSSRPKRACRNGK
ncbi:hypothetical protein NMY22_g2258 [Coprinellus aureogranulatus]|nr:hypothetical protein NMY22_g2258 [Coprinellus aureogranulatus]